jgi:hypothetical protein
MVGLPKRFHPTLNSEVVHWKRYASYAEVFASQEVFLCRCDEGHSHKARNAARPATW